MFNKFHSYTNLLNVICLQLQLTEHHLTQLEEALDTFIQKALETRSVMRYINQQLFKAEYSLIHTKQAWLERLHSSSTR